MPERIQQAGKMGLSEAARRARARGIRWSIASGWQHLRMRWAFRGATRLGWSRLKGRAFVRNEGTMVIGDRVRLDGTIVPLQFACERNARLIVGDGTFFNYGCSVGATESVEIGANCQFGQYTLIMDSNQHSLEDHQARAGAEPVVIEDDVWLGARVTVLPGARIGRGSVVGAHAVVRGVIPPAALAVGVPARVVRRLSPEEHA